MCKQPRYNEHLNIRRVWSLISLRMMISYYLGASAAWPLLPSDTRDKVWASINHKIPICRISSIVFEIGFDRGLTWSYIYRSSSIFFYSLMVQLSKILSYGAAQRIYFSYRILKVPYIIIWRSFVDYTQNNLSWHFSCKRIRLFRIPWG